MGRQRKELVLVFLSTIGCKHMFLPGFPLGVESLATREGLPIAVMPWKRIFALLPEVVRVATGL